MNRGADPASESNGDSAFRTELRLGCDDLISKFQPVALLLTENWAKIWIVCLLLSRFKRVLQFPLSNQMRLLRFSGDLRLETGDFMATFRPAALFSLIFDVNMVGPFLFFSAPPSSLEKNRWRKWGPGQFSEFPPEGPLCPVFVAMQSRSPGSADEGENSHSKMETGEDA